MEKEPENALSIDELTYVAEVFSYRLCHRSPHLLPEARAHHSAVSITLAGPGGTVVLDANGRVDLRLVSDEAWESVYTVSESLGFTHIDPLSLN